MRKMTVSEFCSALEEYTGWTNRVFEWRAENGIHTPYVVVCDIAPRDFRADNTGYSPRTQIELFLITYQPSGAEIRERDEAEQMVERFLSEYMEIPLFDKRTAWSDYGEYFETRYSFLLWQ